MWSAYVPSDVRGSWDVSGDRHLIRTRRSKGAPSRAILAQGYHADVPRPFVALFPPLRFRQISNAQSEDRNWPISAPCRQRLPACVPLHLRLFGYLQCIIDVDTQVTHRAL
jgi:hypothetical protein